MSALSDNLFFARLDKARAVDTVRDALTGCDDGELFLEHALSEHIVLDDGRIRSTAYNAASGFGLRAVCGDAFAHAISNDISPDALDAAAQAVRPIRKGYAGTLWLPETGKAEALYSPENPLPLMPFDAKVALMEQIDAYLRAKDPRVVQVSASLSGEWQVVAVIRADGSEKSDVRPMTGLHISVVVRSGDRMESGSNGAGGRYPYDRLVSPDVWQAMADEALRTALVNLDAVEAPAGEMPVVLGSGWSGVLLHEAVGHGLEGDFNRKGTSVFSGKIGERVAAKGVTVVDDGSIVERRGSLSIDDEGTASQRTVLIEDGILKGYMFDRLNARLMNALPTGNGRRESYACVPQVRMTNTFMTNGDKTPEELIASVKRGVYAKSFHGGQVDITSGKFVFTSAEAYLIEDGKLTSPLKDATLIGSGIEVMNAVDMIANDSALDRGVGSCGKGGQTVPVGVGQPSMRLKKITVGGRG